MSKIFDTRMRKLMKVQKELSVTKQLLLTVYLGTIVMLKRSGEKCE
jgi:hypothetical protein